MFTQEFTGGQAATTPITAAPQQARAPQPVRKAVRALTAVRVRTSTGPAFKTMDTLYPWWTADLVAQWGSWDLVRVADGRRGFVPARYVQVIDR